MKVRVTLMTENAHRMDGTPEEVAACCKEGWEMVCRMFNQSCDPGEKVTVEAVEVIEN